jgi:hypothetical protein
MSVYGTDFQLLHCTKSRRDPGTADMTDGRAMTLALRRTVFLDGERRPDDYEVRHDGRTVGRILRLRSTGRELWHWTQIGIWAPSYGPNGGVADTFEEAKAAFRRTWEAYGAFESAFGRSPRSNEELHRWMAG